MRFAHIADCHIGSWREPKLQRIGIDAFIRVVDSCIAKNIDFMLISGDLFNTSLPAIDYLKGAVGKFRELKDKNIPVYVIAGSHDFSPSGKTILDVLEKAGLFVNVAKKEVVGDKLKLNFTIDEKTGAKITGLYGKRGGLEKEKYKNLIKENLEQEDGYKIFMFHSAIAEFIPFDLKEMVGLSLSSFPKNFNYYAGGHVHYVFKKEVEGYGLVTYPGPCFPNNFRELEKLETGGFYIVDVINGKTTAEYEPIQVYNVFKIFADAENKNPEQVEQDILEQIKEKEFNNTIVTIRVKGKLKSGKPNEINFKNIFSILYGKSAYFVMKNTSKLTSEEFEEIKVESESQEEIEEQLIKEHLGQIKVSGFDSAMEEKLTRELVRILDTERQEGERVADFERRISDDANKILGL